MRTAQEYPKAYMRRRSLALLAAILAENFEAAAMLTLRYSGANIPPAVAVSQIRWLRTLAKRMVGGPFRYVQTAMYDHSGGQAKPIIPADRPASCESLRRAGGKLVHGPS